MAYLQLETMKEMSEQEVRSLFPNTSFPTPFVAPDGFVYVFPTPQPTVGELQVAVKDGVEQDSKGNWVDKWAVKDMFADVTLEDGTVVTKAEQEAKYLADKAKALVPQSVSMRQARIQLLRAGLLDEVNQAVASNQEWAITWEFATEVRRDDPMIAAVQEGLGMTDDQIDSLFIEASKL